MFTCRSLTIFMCRKSAASPLREAADCMNDKVKGLFVIHKREVRIAFGLLGYIDRDGTLLAVG